MTARPHCVRVRLTDAERADLGRAVRQRDERAERQERERLARQRYAAEKGLAP